MDDGFLRSLLRVHLYLTDAESARLCAKLRRVDDESECGGRASQETPRPLPICIRRSAGGKTLVTVSIDDLGPFAVAVAQAIIGE